MNRKHCDITVYYDGTCPLCVESRNRYEKLSGGVGENVCWFDINGAEEHLREIGINPQNALMELHVEDQNHRILSEIDAYILLMKKVPLLRPLAYLIDLPVIRPILAKVYHRRVNRRLKRSGRL